MIWQDLLLDRWIDEATLRQATATALDLPASGVAVIDEVEQLAAITPDIRVILERVRQHRDFPLQLTVVLRDENLAKRLVGVDGALRVTRQLAVTLNASVVFAEGPLAPSSWIRVRPSGQLDLVSLDTDDTTDTDSFFVAAEHPFSVTQTADAARGSRRSA